MDTDCPDRASGPRPSFHPRIVSELWTQQGTEQEGEGGLAQRVLSVIRKTVGPVCLSVGQGLRFMCEGHTLHPVTEASSKVLIR